MGALSIAFNPLCLSGRKVEILLLLVGFLGDRVCLFFSKLNSDQLNMPYVGRQSHD